MRTHVIHWSVVGALALSLLAATIGTTGSARAAERTSHPDFAWWPTGHVQGTRLYVGNLSMHSID